MKTRALGVGAAIALVAALGVGLYVVPADANQGDAQRIMYPHVAAAWLAYLSFGVTALGGVMWLWKRDLRWDALALSGAEIGVLFTALAIWGGMMWGRPVWGTFWTWDPRLTTTALLLALYLGYLLLRSLSDDPARRATRAAIAGLVAAVDIPLVHFSTEWWRGLHQTATFLSPQTILDPPAPLLFRLALIGTVVAFTLVWGYLLIRRYQLARLEWQLEEHARLGRLSAARRVGAPLAPLSGEAVGGRNP